MRWERSEGNEGERTVDGGIEKEERKKGWEGSKAVFKYYWK